MSLSNQEIAFLLDNAAQKAKAVAQVSAKQSISIKDAYAIQKTSIEQRYTRGEKLVGLKLGFTSKAKMEQMGVHDMIWGRLTNSMQYKNGDDLSLKKFIHPRAEPEIAFLIKKDITKPITLKTAPSVLIGIAAAIEIIDSRYEKFKFSLEDVIADNCSSTGFVLGQWYDPSTDIADISMELCVNDEVIHSGSSAAILGNPMQSLVDAVRLSLQYGEPLKRGMVVLAGAATPAIYLKKGDKVEARVKTLGKVGLKVVK